MRSFFFSSSSRLLAAAGLALLVAACSSTIHKSSKVGGVNALSLDAKQRLVVVHRNAYGHPMVCAEPSPDAIVAISAAFAANASGTRATGQNIKAAIAGGSSESVASMAMRTASVQMLRDGYYRLCEAAMNDAIKSTPYTDGIDRSTAYSDVIGGIGPFIASVMAVDAIGGGQHPPAIAISGGKATATANAPGSSTAIAGSNQGLFIEDLTVAEADPAKRKVEAEAIQDIARLYIRHKCEVHGGHCPLPDPWKMQALSAAPEEGE